MTFDQYQDILRRHLPYAGDTRLTETSVLADLGLDSLGVVRLLSELEDTFDTELADEVLNAATFRTAGSLWHAFSA